MRLTALHLHDHFCPSLCELRLFLQEQGVEAAPIGPFHELLIELGKRHELQHLEEFPEFVDLKGLDLDERFGKALEAIEGGAPVIYQAAFRTEYELEDGKAEIVGEPDFLVREDAGYTIRDCKISRRITEKDHPEILLQLQLYGWLYEQVLGIPPLRLEIWNGARTIIPVEYDNGVAALGKLVEIQSAIRSSDVPYTPVGWSKCNGCGYFGHCWPRAEQRKDVALLPGVDQGLARALRDHGVTSYDELLSKFDETSLAKLRRPWGKGMRRVGAHAAPILKNAQAMSRNEEIWLGPPDIPNHDNYVMFDLEGMPPHLDELEKIYLWGMQVYGAYPSEYIAAVAAFDEQGDETGWRQFLQKAGTIFDTYGDIPFVHWHIYERTNLNKYVNRYGDPDRVAARVLENLLDLHPITAKAVALPLPSYSLKVIEKHLGFARTQDEFGGACSMAKYIEATETHNEALRNEVMDKILTYNEEDLAATWKVLQWLQAKQQ